MPCYLGLQESVGLLRECRKRKCSPLPGRSREVFAAEVIFELSLEG